MYIEITVWHGKRTILVSTVATLNTWHIDDAWNRLNRAFPASDGYHLIAFEVAPGTGRKPVRYSEGA